MPIFLATSLLLNSLTEPPRRRRIRFRSKLNIQAIFLLITLVSAAETASADQERLPNLLENEHQLSMAFETPHTKWAKPYAGGTTRVLFFTPWYQGSTEGRETIELMQRFDLEADVAYFIKGPNCLLGDNNPRPYVTVDAGTQRVLRLLKIGYDVYFFNQVQFDSLPTAIQLRIRQNVFEGAGMVIVGDVEKPSFENARHNKNVKEIAGNAKGFSYGKGRIVLLPPRTKLEYTHGWEVKLDYQMADQGRALLWAAQRAPGLNVQINLSATSVDRGNISSNQVTVSWDKASGDATLKIILRRGDGVTQPLGECDLTADHEAKFSVPKLRAGEYQVEAVARSSNGIEDWRFTPLVVTSVVGIDAVELEKNWAERDSTVRGTVKLRGTTGSQHTVRTRLVDVHGRVIVQQDAAISGAKQVDFEFAMRPWMPMLLRVEALLLEGDSEVSAAYAYLNVTRRHQNQFNFVLWNGPSGDLAPYGQQSFAQQGVTAILQGGEPPLSMAASNLSFVPYASSYRKSSHTVTAMLDDAGIMKGGCTNNPQVMEEWVRTTVERHDKARQHGTLVYSLGDENAVRGSCLSDHCLHAYQDYLKRIYGTIKALNQEWETDYASFEAIRLLEEEELPAADAPRWFKEYFAQRLQKNRTDSEGSGEQQIIHGDLNDEMRALQTENFARWYDRQAFQCENYVNWCKQFAVAFRKIDPKSLTGFEGTDSFSLRRLTTRSRQGGDLDAFVRELEYFGPYHGPGNEVVRSIAPPKFPMGNWFGYSMDPEVLMERYWEQVTNCINTIQWWRWDNLNGYHGFLSPTLSPFPEVQEYLDDTRIVREGLGSLLMECNMQDDQVAMLYSMPSTHIAHFDGNRSYGHSTRDHSLWHQALHDSGVQFRYVTDRMLRLGEFDAKRFKVLILPLSFAIGPKEAEVIRDFVRGGGTLLADVRTGIYDGHCKPLEEGILDDVFGIKRTGKQDAIKLDRLGIGGEINGQPVEMRWGNYFGKEIYPQMKVDPSVTLTTGKALGQAFPIHFWGGLNHPVGIVNEFGKGRAVLLNFPIYHATAQPLIEGILASAGVEAKIKLRTPQGERITGLEITRWQNQEIELVALFGTYEGEVAVTLPDNRQVYKMKTQQHLGNVREFTTTVRPHRAKFFAMLLKDTTKPQINLKQSSVNRGSVVNAELSLPKTSGKHSVSITLQTPDGKTADWFHEKRIVDHQSQTVAIPVAHNDPTGTWKIIATELYSGITTARSLTVK